MIDFKALAAPFDPAKISWRVGPVNNKDNPTQGIALAYIDARDVQDRLDAVCGPGNWQTRYPHAGQKTICEVGIKVGDEWVWKSDGAGDTDMEAEKGAISDAFKRAAVKWGIGRYLYDCASPWVAVVKKGKTVVIADSEMGKLQRLLPGSRPEPPKAEPERPTRSADDPNWVGPLAKSALKERVRAIGLDIENCQDEHVLPGLLRDNIAVINQCARDLPEWWFNRLTGSPGGLKTRIQQAGEDLRVDVQHIIDGAEARTVQQAAE